MGEGVVGTQIFNRQSHSLHQRPDNFDSALAQHVHDNPHHFVLVENTSIIASVKGLLQVFREEIKISEIDVIRNI